MCGDVVATMEFRSVRATYEGDGWGVVVVVPTAHGARATVLLVALDLQIDASVLWHAVVAAAGASGISLPPAPAGPPTSPGAGVREWHLPMSP